MAFQLFRSLKEVKLRMEPCLRAGIDFIQLSLTGPVLQSIGACMTFLILGVTVNIAIITAMCLPLESHILEIRCVKFLIYLTLVFR